MILPHCFITLGLDISDYKLRLAVLRFGYRKPELRAFSELELSPGIIVNGVVQQPQPLVLALKQLIKQAKGKHFRERTVRVGLPEQQSFITTLAAGTVPLEQLSKEAIRNIPFQETEMYFDEYSNVSRQTVTIAAGRKEFIDQYLTILEAANLQPIGLYVEAYALTKALCPPHSATSTMIIDLGLARTTILFYLQEAIYFTTSYPSVIDAQGINQNNLHAVVEQMLRYYQAHYHKISSLQNIILCGSGAQVPNIAEFIESACTVPTQLGNPMQALRSVRLDKKIPNPLGFSTAIGLALI